MKEQRPQPHTLHLGSITIGVQDDAFQHGYQQGYLRYQQTYAGQPLDERIIHDFIRRNITHTMASDRENAGYIAGWFAALLSEPRRVEQQSSESQTPSFLQEEVA